MKFIFIVAALAVSTAVYAQQQSPMEQALAQKLMSEVNTSLQCGANLVTLQGQLQSAQARIKDLETKLPPTQ